MSEAEAWKEKLPEEVLASSLMNGVDSEDKFWKRVQDQHSYAGMSIKIPGEDASDEALAEFRNKLKDKVPGLVEVPGDDDDDGYNAVLAKLGKPEKADDYQVPEGDYQFTPEQAANLRDIAANAGMTKRQFRNLAKKFAENAGKQSEAVATERKANEDALKGEWGMATEEKYAQVIEFAKNNGAPEHFVKALEGKTAKAAEVLWMAKLMGAGKEGSNVAGQDGISAERQGAKLTPYEAEEKLAEIYNNPAHPFHKSNGDPNSPSVKRVLELIEMAG